MKETLLKFKRACACLFIFIGGFGLPTALLSFAMPFGATVRDHNDPLGATASPAEAMLVIGIYAVILVVGIGLAVSCRRDGNKS